MKEKLIRECCRTKEPHAHRIVAEGASELSAIELDMLHVIQTSSTGGVSMATKTVVTVESDLSGSEGADTHTFSLDGTEYEIDLTDKEHTSLQKSLSKYVEAGRKTNARRGPRRTQVKAGGGATTQAIREWARSQGLQVPDRGRIPNAIQEQFDAAHPA